MAETRIAHVGAFDPFSSNDQYRAARSTCGFVEGGWQPAGEVQHEVINLCYGRDFLSEPDERYDIVILHSLYHPPRDGGIPLRTLPTEIRDHCGVSPLHSVENWRAALTRSGAQWIFAFEGGCFCLHGWLLGELPGYSTVFQDEIVTTYRRTP